MPAENPARGRAPEYDGLRQANDESRWVGRPFLSCPGRKTELQRLYPQHGEGKISLARPLLDYRPSLSIQWVWMVVMGGLEPSTYGL